MTPQEIDRIQTEVDAMEKQIETLLSNQSELKWIPCYPSELPTDKVLWVTCDNGWYRYVKKVFWDMTEWSENVSDVVAYIPYEEPEPYIGESDHIMPDEDNLEKRLFGRVDNIILLEDMKKIMKESLDNAKTHGDFLVGMIIGAYELGIEHGKASCQKWTPCYPSELPKDKKLWVTHDRWGCRYLGEVSWDMTEWSDNVSDVVAYMPYVEPEPYIGEET